MIIRLVPMQDYRVVSIVAVHPRMEVLDALKWPVQALALLGLIVMSIMNFDAPISIASILSHCLVSGLQAHPELLVQTPLSLLQGRLIALTFFSLVGLIAIHYYPERIRNYSVNIRQSSGF